MRSEVETEESYLRGLKRRFGITEESIRSLLADDLLGSWHRYAIELVLETESIFSRRDEPWEFRSIEELIRHDFSASSPVEAIAAIVEQGESGVIDSKAFLDYISASIGAQVNEWLFNIRDGIRPYVKGGDGRFVEADDGNEHFQLVRMLVEHKISVAGHMSRPPPWTSELYIWRRNYDAFSLFFHDHSDIGDPLTSMSLAARRDAVLAYTDRTLGAERALLNLPQELAIALAAHEAVRGSPDLLRRKTPKQALVQWLKVAHPELSVGAVERISTVANWEPTGGAPRQG